VPPDEVDAFMSALDARHRAICRAPALTAYFRDVLDVAEQGRARGVEVKTDLVPGMPRR
jgi:hypothetical protein